MKNTMTEINDMTGFSSGAKFACENDVKLYFTVAAQIEMYGECTIPQCDLDGYANDVISAKWHCEF